MLLIESADPRSLGGQDNGEDARGSVSGPRMQTVRTKKFYDAHGPVFEKPFKTNETKCLMKLDYPCRRATLSSPYSI